MYRYFLYIYDYLASHRRWATVLLLLLLALMGVLSFQVKYEEDISKFLPQDPKREKFQEVYQQISAQEKIAVIFTSADSTHVVGDDTLELAMAEMGQKLEASRLTQNLQVTVDDARLQATTDFVYQHIPYFLHTSDLQRIDSLLSIPGYVDRQMQVNRQMLMTPMGGMMMSTLKYDPLHLFTPVVERLRGTGLGSARFQLIDGYLFSRDGQYAMITFDTPYGVSETHHNAILADSLEAMSRAVEQRYPQVCISAIGAPLIAVTNAQQIKADALMSVSIAVFLILVILIWHYRRLQDLFWISGSLFFGWLFALAGMALFSDSVSIIVLGIGSVIIGIAINYPLHFLDHLREVADRRAALRDMLPPLLIGNITTVAAFLCLIWLDAQAMRDLGLFGSLMLIGTILFVLVFLPLYVKTSNTKSRTIVSSSLRFPKIPYLLPVVVVLTMILGYFSLQTSFDDDLSHINYMTASQHADMQRLSSTVSASPVYVVVEAENLEAALTKDRRIRQQLEALADTRVDGLGNLLSDQARQKQQLRLWDSLLEKHPELSPTFHAACTAMGFSADAFAPFVQLMKAERQPLPYQDFKPITDLYAGRYVFTMPHGVRLVNYVTITNEEQVKALVDGAFSSKDLSNQLVEILNHSFNYVGLVCGVVVFFFLWLSFGKLELTLMTFLPLAVSWVWILGLMHLVDVQFNIVNIILATFIFGQGDDYSIFMTEGLLYEYTTGHKRLASYKHSVLLSALLMFIGIGCLVFARHPALRSLGSVTIIGMVTVVFMSYYLSPLVFGWLTRDREVRRYERHQTFITRPLPMTIKRVGYSLYTILFFLVFMYLGALPYTWLLFHLHKDNDALHLRYHRAIQRTARFMLKVIPGLKYRFDNSVGETFCKPAVIICNHQSHLDIISLLCLTPKLIIVTNNWTWNNPFYGSVLHHGDFLPAAAGMAENLPKLRKLYEKGYSILIYPEGTRSEDCSIMRFHKGAFYLAHALGADLLPMYVHGPGYVLPKKDFMLREGEIYVEAGQRVRYDSYDDEGLQANAVVLAMTHRMRRQYQEHYAELCRRIETPAYLQRYQCLRDYYKLRDGGADMA